MRTERERDAWRVAALLNGHQAAVELDRQRLFELGELLTALSHFDPPVFDRTVPLDAIELIDTIADILGREGLTLHELTERARAEQPEPKGEVVEVSMSAMRQWLADNPDVEVLG